jgi:hypothetical protein
VGPPNWGIEAPPPTAGQGPGFPTNPIGGYVIAWIPGYGWVTLPVGLPPQSPGGGTEPPTVDNTLPATEPEPK